MKPRILQNGPLLPALEARLAAAFDLQRLPDGPDRAAFLRQRGGEFVGLVTSAPCGAEVALIDALPSLRVISSFGVGFDKLDAARTVPRGIPVGHTPDVLNDWVADVAYHRFDTPHELSRWADFLVVAVAGGASTRHLVSREVMAALGPTGFLINVSRGTVVDEAALIEALVQKRIAGAGLDVYEHEPQVPQALMDLDNVVLLPHIASGTHETRRAMADLVFDNLSGFFEHGALKCAVPWSAPAGR